MARGGKKTWGEKTIKEFPPLRDTHLEQLRSRVVQSVQGVGFDLRQYLKTESFEGFTRRGVRLDWEAFQMLKEQLPAIEKELHEASQKAEQASQAAAGGGKGATRPKKAERSSSTPRAAAKGGARAR